MRQRSWPALPWLGGLLALYLIAPFLAGLAMTGGAGWASADWGSLGAAVAVSLLSATAATVLVALGAIPLGLLLARRSGRAMALLGFVVQLPLALPPLASGILLLFLLGYASPLGALTHGALTDSFIGIVLAEAFVAAPFLIIAARSAFGTVDPVLEDVAATLGHGPSGVFFRASLPLAWRGIAAGMLLCWLRAFGEFGATVMVAYHPYSLPVYTFVAFGSEGLPAMLPILAPTLGAAFAVMLLATRLTPSRAGRTDAPATMLAAEETAVEAAPHPAGIPPQPRGIPPPLRFAFRRALDGFTLGIDHETTARRIALLGASGSGKSLTLRAIAGLDHQRDDRLDIGGRILSSLPPERRGIAYVPQSYGLFPHLTAERQLRFATDSDADRARFWFERLGLAGLERRLPSTLSLGQQQRVAIARAFCRPSRLLLLDEPFSALDTPLRAQLRQELRRLQAEVAATTILVTHDPEEAFILADELIVLQAGLVLQAGPVNAVFARPANATVARILGAETIASGVTAAADAIDIGSGIRIAVAGPPLPPAVAVAWSVAPERLRVGASGGHAGMILEVGPTVAGRQTLTVRLGDAVLRIAQEADPALRPGAARIVVPPAAVQVWQAAPADAGQNATTRLGFAHQPAGAVP
ncbi:MAG: ATP-binding cassette domain-containing protein [Proteobacteria bacterium]|nr:ATP-binding cassette domain-containing protein [Pseudomonadota bacterium]